MECGGEKNVHWWQKIEKNSACGISSEWKIKMWNMRDRKLNVHGRSWLFTLYILSIVITRILYAWIVLLLLSFWLWNLLANLFHFLTFTKARKIKENIFGRFQQHTHLPFHKNARKYHFPFSLPTQWFSVESKILFFFTVWLVIK